MVLGAGLVWGLRNPNGLQASEAGLAVFTVKNLSCGSCVKNIQSTLARVEGVGTVEVSVTSGLSRVEYDPGRIRAEELAQRITEAGYPAELREALPPKDYQALREEDSRLSGLYVARIGTRLLPREELDRRLQNGQNSLRESSDPQTERRVLRDAWSALLQRELLLNAAETQGIVVQESEVAQEVSRMSNGSAGFEDLIRQRFGDREAFSRHVRDELTIGHLIDQQFTAKGLPAPERRQALQQWYQRLVETTPVVIFDPAIKAATSEGGAGCGGSCCS